MTFKEVWKLVQEYGEACEQFGQYLDKRKLDDCYRTEKKLREALKEMCEED